MPTQVQVNTIHLYRANIYALRDRRVTWIETKREREEPMLGRSQIGQAWLELQSQQMQRRRDWGPQYAGYYP